MVNENYCLEQTFNCSVRQIDLLMQWLAIAYSTRGRGFVSYPGQLLCDKVLSFFCFWVQFIHKMYIINNIKGCIHRNIGNRLIRLSALYVSGTKIIADNINLGAQ